MENKLSSVIIVAGGSGRRMKTKIPKQFLKIKGLPILMYTIKLFYKFDKDIEIILVLPAEQIEYWHSLCSKHKFKIKHKVVKGGEERFYSVRNGLRKMKSDKGLVAIHDGVRPFVSQKTIARGVKKAQKYKTAIPVISENNSVRILDGKLNKHIDRDKVKIVQTPQIFDKKLIKKAYKQDYSPNYTDDASVVENFGASIYLYKGNVENIKITTKLDLKFAKFLISGKKK